MLTLEFRTEAIVRGHKAGLLTVSDYNNLCQCETLDDIKLHLVSTGPDSTGAILCCLSCP